MFMTSRSQYPIRHFGASIVVGPNTEYVGALDCHWINIRYQECMPRRHAQNIFGIHVDAEKGASDIVEVISSRARVSNLRNGSIIYTAASLEQRCQRSECATCERESVCGIAHLSVILSKTWLRKLDHVNLFGSMELALW
jgi:hypothetical protein